MRRTRLSMAVAAMAVLLPALPLEAQQFGAAAAVSGDVVLVSEPMNQDGPAQVHVYRRAGDDWIEEGTLQRPEGGEEIDYFGRFLAIEGDELFVGGTTFDDTTGAVWRFRRAGDGWDFVDHIRPADVGPGDSFGRAGVVEDGLFFVSSLGHMGTGAVWVFRQEGDRWVEEAKLLPENGPEGHFFGWSMAYDGEGDRLLVGAMTQQTQNRGAVHVFRREGPGQWTQEAALDPGEDAPAGLQFGAAVAWLDGLALVGAPGADGFAGAVQVFERNAMTNAWSPGLTLTAHDRQEGAGFGASVAPAEGGLWVGAPAADRAGRVYAMGYDPASGRFTDVRKMGGLDQDVGDQFGATVALGDDVAVVGQVGDDFNMGSAIILGRRTGEWRAQAKVMGETPAALPALTGEDVACQGGEADQFPCDNVDIVSFLPVQAIGGGRGAETNDVWGWTDPETGREIAIVGRTDGTAFIDITDANRPVYLGNLPKTPGSRGNAWRDIKVFENHAYVVADGALDHGMQVFDLTRLRDVRSPPATFEPDVLYEGIASAHNIVINEETGFAYAVGANSGGETCGGALHIIDINEPKDPTFVGCFADTRTGRAGTGYSHDAQCFVYDGPDREHAGKEICFGSNETALAISDVSDKENPVAISAADYPNVGYAHQGWITPDHRYFFMNDEGDESNAVQSGQPMEGTRTLVWDVEDLDDPIMVKEHFGETFTIDHNLYIKDDLMYQSNYVSGLRILDISDPLNPREVGYLDTVPWSEEVEFDGSWSNYPYFQSGTIVVSSGREGIFFLKYNPPNLIP
ncbi:MAG: choice-of-anchor B family protein [Gemmatimonadetes bacterium]|nr:choice-of-anchor B family protein [Gemmatimonadota bacterium]